MRQVSAKFVPTLLGEQQKQLRLEIAQDLLDCANSDSDFMKTIITGDKTWVYWIRPRNKISVITCHDMLCKDDNPPGACWISAL